MLVTCGYIRLYITWPSTMPEGLAFHWHGQWLTLSPLTFGDISAQDGGYLSCTFIWVLLLVTKRRTGWEGRKECQSWAHFLACGCGSGMIWTRSRGPMGGLGLSLRFPRVCCLPCAKLDNKKIQTNQVLFCRGAWIMMLGVAQHWFMARAEHSPNLMGPAVTPQQGTAWATPPWASFQSRVLVCQEV